MQTSTGPTAAEPKVAPTDRGGESLSYRPNVDIRDDGDAVVILADLPGARADGIDVTFEDGVLSLHAAVPSRQMPGKPLRQEYGIGDYRRSFRLGDGFDASLITADYVSGVLTLRVPRLAAVRPRKIAVRAG
jgi:HSP20 family protein